MIKNTSFASRDGLHHHHHICGWLLGVKNQQEVPCEEGFATSNAFGDVQMMAGQQYSLYNVNSFEVHHHQLHSCI